MVANRKNVSTLPWKQSRGTEGPHVPLEPHVKTPALDKVDMLRTSQKYIKLSEICRRCLTRQICIYKNLLKAKMRNN